MEEKLYRVYKYHGGNLHRVSGVIARTSGKVMKIPLLTKSSDLSLTLDKLLFISKSYQEQYFITNDETDKIEAIVNCGKWTRLTWEINIEQW